MKTIKIKICHYNPREEISFGKFFIARLEQFYQVELSEDPDYVFFYERADEHLKYPNAIRIFYTGENVHPDFNIADFAISFDYLEFGDRHFRLPLYMLATLYSTADIAAAGDLTFEKVESMTHSELQRKTGFCSFVYSNYLADPRRKDLFDALSQYKKVDSGGKYLNNVGGPIENKLLFERDHKFSIAFENSSRTGYTTEKLPAALAARTIPIYFGNPDISKEFNTKRFINMHEYQSVEAVVARVKEIDQNDDLYLSIINEPVLASGFHYDDTLTALDAFLCHIMDQPLKEAPRRSINAVHAHLLEEREKAFFAKKRRSQLLQKIRTVFDYIPGFRSLKQAIRKKSIHS